MDFDRGSPSEILDCYFEGLYSLLEHYQETYTLHMAKSNYIKSVELKDFGGIQILGEKSNSVWLGVQIQKEFGHGEAALIRIDSDKMDMFKFCANCTYSSLATAAILYDQV